MRPNTDMKTARVLTAILLGAVLLANIIGCSHSTRPKDVKYNMYVGASHLNTSPDDSSYSRIYVYDADSLTLLDSIYHAEYVQELAVSPDGRWLFALDFIGPREPRTLWKIETQSGRVSWSRTDRKGHLHFQDNGRLLLVGNDVLDPEDGVLLRHISDSLAVLWGPESGNKVAALVHSSLTEYSFDSVVTLVDVTSGDRVGRFVAHLPSGVPLDHFLTARLHPDGRRVLAIGLKGSVYYSWFVVGDVITGQTLFAYQITFPRGEIAISSDGSLAAFTDPGTAAFGESGMPYVIDLRTYTVITPPAAALARASQVRFLPGDRRIVTASAADNVWDAGPVDVFDAATLKREKRVWPMGDSVPDAPNIGGIAVGPRR